MRSRWTVFFVVLAVFALAGGYAWLERHTLFVWHYARQLGTADVAERARLAEQLAVWEPLAWTRLVRQLEADDAALCRGSAEVMLTWLRRRSGADTKSEQIVSVLLERWPRLSVAGREEACWLVRECVAQAPPPRAEVWSDLILRLLQTAAAEEADGIRGHLLHLGWQVIALPTAEPALPSLRRLAEGSLRSANAAIRVLAVRLAGHPRLQMQDQVAALLRGPGLDPAPEVRAMAVLMLGATEAALATDDLLPFLHDSDAEVRLLAEQALRSRGLGPMHLQLGRMMVHPEVTQRAQVPSQVLELPDLDVNLWLQRLTQDPAPAVRAAVARAVAESQEPALRVWLEKLADSDPSPTVQQLARHYLRTWPR